MVAIAIDRHNAFVGGAFGFFGAGRTIGPVHLSAVITTMKTDRIVGSAGIRLATILTASLAVAMWLIVGLGLTQRASGVGVGALILTLLSVMGGVHTSATIYARWMRFAGILNQVMTTLLFGVVYFVVVPPFALVMWLVDPLALKSKSTVHSTWRERHRQSVDFRSLQRMG